MSTASALSMVPSWLTSAFSGTKLEGVLSTRWRSTATASAGHEVGRCVVHEMAQHSHGVGVVHFAIAVGIAEKEV